MSVDDLKRRERNRSKNERWRRFITEIGSVFDHMDNIHVDDRILLDHIRHSIIVFMSKDKFKENSTFFLENEKIDFYYSIEEFEKNHPEYSFFYTKLFMEDFYF